MLEFKLTWDDVYNPTEDLSFVDVYSFMKNTLSTSGYIYFNWFGRIYEASNDCRWYFDTGVRVEDLDKNKKGD